MKPRAVMIFAAGFGTRMMPLTRDRPKPMVALRGRPLLDHALDHARQVCPDRIVVNTHYKGDVIKAHLSGSDIHIIDEQPEILDTGGGLRNALPIIGTEPVMTLNPDTVWYGENPLSLAMRSWEPDRMDALLVCIDRVRAFGTDSDGDFVLASDGRLTRGIGVIYGGAQIIKTDLLDRISGRVFSLNKIWDVLLAKGRCYGITYPGKWCDVGHPAGLEQAEALFSMQNDV